MYLFHEQQSIPSRNEPTVGMRSMKILCFLDVKIVCTLLQEATRAINDAALRGKRIEFFLAALIKKKF